MGADEKLKRALQDDWEFVGDPWQLCHILREKILSMADQIVELRRQIVDISEMAARSFEEAKIAATHEAHEWFRDEIRGKIW